MAEYCRSCGASMADGTRFCAVCGTAATARVANPIPVGTRPLIRPRAGRIIAGVCQGIANQHGWDPAWVRVIAVLATIFAGGLGLIAYIVLWVVVPEEPYLLPPTTTYTPTSGS